MRDYLEGRTPIPCARCNTEVKFESLVDEDARPRHRARGHRATTRARTATRRRAATACSKGADAGKDQSYFLFGLTPGAARGARSSPWATCEKAEVRAPGRASGGCPPPTRPRARRSASCPTATTRASSSATPPPRTARGRSSTARAEAWDDTRASTASRWASARASALTSARPALRARGACPSTRTVVVGDEADLAARPPRRARGELALDRRARARPLRATVKIRYRHAEAPATIEPLAGRPGPRCASTRRSAPSPRARPRSSTTATSAWAAAGSSSRAVQPERITTETHEQGHLHAGPAHSNRRSAGAGRREERP